MGWQWCCQEHSFLHDKNQNLVSVVVTKLLLSSTGSSDQSGTHSLYEEAYVDNVHLVSKHENLLTPV
jgi:hypothetical protein